MKKQKLGHQMYVGAEQLTRQQLKTIMGGQTPVDGDPGGDKCSKGTCSAKQTCKVPAATTNCACVDTDNWSHGGCTFPSE